ncbi:hypothetical protein CHU93_15805 [Sandarakinorhabdus cyanobacteriorum]|uniref:Uncharacterized protein n=1 Tax=Sandarakinorhabdus cyanobacteriorum TaxID=1981098 RepID=A0A255Y572_9SPHN|nr:hypothetical protein [Sandarakinorhabdus cyanobacteriorum]OYQ24303.1 hypothetical protein CHU93_15805 [Sandarakinorhabdus cyanobacteriorum]
MTPDRRGLLTALALGLAAPAIAVPAGVAVEEWTFLKASTADPAPLLRFLEANWLVMDRLAVAQGLFAHARLYRADPADGASWDVVMIVGYRTPAGYEGVRAAFEAIRAAHRPVQPDGQPLAALGRIVESRRVQLVASA